jgi:hypothetical protein
MLLSFVGKSQTPKFDITGNWKGSDGVTAHFVQTDSNVSFTASNDAAGSGSYQSSKKFTIRGTNKCGNGQVKWLGTYTVISNDEMSFTYEFTTSGCGCSEGQTGTVNLKRVD